MATKPKTIEETHCDRCDRRIAKQRPLVVLHNHGVDTLAGIECAMNVHAALDLCRPCETSLRGWWTRGKKSDA